MQEAEEKTTDVFYRFRKHDILKENGLRRNGKGRIRMKRAYFNCILLDGTGQMEPVAHKMVLAFHKLLTDDEYVVNELELKKMYPVVEPEEKAPTSPSNGSRTVKYGALGAILGAVLAGVFFLLRAVMDVTIRSEKDLRECSALPILGTLPYYEGAVESGEQLLKKADK